MTAATGPTGAHPWYKVTVNSSDLSIMRHVFASVGLRYLVDKFEGVITFAWPWLSAEQITMIQTYEDRIEAGTNVAAFIHQQQSG